MSQGTIHFPVGCGAEEWTWRYGRRHTVVIRDPARRKFAVAAARILGCTWEDIERARWKESRGSFEVTPAKVKAYIVENLRKKA
jgi:hypothetical protein